MLIILINLVHLFSCQGLASQASQSSALDAVRVFKLGQPPQGHCTGFIAPGNLALHSAGHCDKPTTLYALDQLGEPQQTSTEEERKFFSHPLGVVDAMTLADGASEDLLNSEQITQISLTEISQMAPMVGLGFPGRWRELTEPSQLLCEEAKIEGPQFSALQVERSLGTLHLRCWSLKVNGKVVPLSELQHRDIAGMSGGPVVANGQVVGILYHFDERSRLIKVQKLDAPLQLEERTLVVRRHNLTRRLFEEVKLPNSVHIQIDDLFLQAGLPFSQRNSLQLIDLDAQGARLEFVDGNVAETSAPAGVLLRNYLSWLSTSSQ